MEKQRDRRRSGHLDLGKIVIPNPNFKLLRGGRRIGGEFRDRLHGVLAITLMPDPWMALNEMLWQNQQRISESCFYATEIEMRRDGFRMR